MYRKIFKQLFDIVLALIALILLFPVFIFIIFLLSIANKGKPFFIQSRPGRSGKIFKIVKFKTMNDKIDSNGNLLPDIDRLTKIGNFVRKTSLDEIPQLINVIKGDMSLIGPRPERRYFIDQIVERNPEYTLLLKVKPGITSWGQVKYGYAENVDEMIERLQYDLLYIENLSIATDIKILLYTFIIIFQGRGK